MDKAQRVGKSTMTDALSGLKLIAASKTSGLPPDVGRLLVFSLKDFSQVLRKELGLDKVHEIIFRLCKEEDLLCSRGACTWLEHLTPTGFARIVF